MNQDDPDRDSRSFVPPSCDGDSYWDDEHEVSVPLDPSDAWGPDTLGRVVEVDAMVAIFAADRLEWVHAFRVEQLREHQRWAADAGPADSPFDRRSVPDLAERSIRLELACALKISEYAAERMTALAEALVETYPDVLASMRSGNLSERHVNALIDTADEIAEEHRAALVTQGLEWAQELPYGTFRRKLRTFAAELQVKTIEEQHEAAFTERLVGIRPAPNGMAWLNIFTSEVEAHAIFHRVTAMGKAVGKMDPADARTIDQRRADVVTDLLLDGDVGSYPDTARGIRPTVAVTVPSSPFLGATRNRQRSRGSVRSPRHRPRTLRHRR